MRYLLLAGAFAFMLLFAACGGDEEQAQSTPTLTRVETRRATASPRVTATATPIPQVTRPDPDALVPAGYALDQTLDASLDGTETGQIVVIGHTIRKDKVGNPVVSELPLDCPADPVAGSPCAFRVEVFAYDPAAGWGSVYVDDHGNKFAGAEQGVTAQSFGLTDGNRAALVVTSDRASGVGPGTGPVHTVLAMEEGQVKMVYETDIKAGFNVQSGLIIFDEPHFAESDPLCCPSGRRISKVGLDQATGQVRVLDVQIVPLNP